MVVNLKFESIEDFEPGRVIEQVPPLKRLLETRNKLRDLMTKADGSEQLENLLESILKDQTSLDRLKRELEPGAATSPSGEKA